MSSNGKSRRRIFTVETPLGYRVFLTRDRWRQIIRQKHPALAGQEKLVRECLQSPANDEERFVVTAYFTSNIKKGAELWKK